MEIAVGGEMVWVLLKIKEEDFDFFVCEQNRCLGQGRE